MSELVQIVDSLENKVSKLLHKINVLHQANQKLENELVSIKTEKENVNSSATNWEEKYNSLKLANSMLGSNTNKTEAKLKINALIRDLDHCIAQLSE